MALKVSDYKRKRRAPAGAKKTATTKLPKAVKTEKAAPKKRKFEVVADSSDSPSSSDAEGEGDEETKEEKKVNAKDVGIEDDYEATGGENTKSDDADAEGDEETEETEEDDADSPYLSHSYSRVSLWASNWVLPETLSRYDELVDDFSTELMKQVRLELKMKPHHLLECAGITDDQLFDAINKVQWKIIPLPRFLRVADIDEGYWADLGKCRYDSSEYRKETIRAFKADFAE